MKVLLCEDTDWLLSEEAFLIYAPCMFHPTYLHPGFDFDFMHCVFHLTLFTRRPGYPY